MLTDADWCSNKVKPSFLLLKRTSGLSRSFLALSRGEFLFSLGPTPVSLQALALTSSMQHRAAHTTHAIIATTKNNKPNNYHLNHIMIGPAHVPKCPCLKCNVQWKGLTWQAMLLFCSTSKGGRLVPHGLPRFAILLQPQPRLFPFLPFLLQATKGLHVACHASWTAA